MKIRRLERAYYDCCFEMLQEFSRSIEVLTFSKEHYDRNQVFQVLIRCEYTGASFVSEDRGEITGMILSMITPELWFPKQYRLVELAWWVKPAYRSSTAAARLFHSYKRLADEFRQQGRIQTYTMSRMHNSPKLDYERRGFRRVEETYLMGE
jgi:RimJ/RimL family protein N-acetyltransferase